MESPTNRAILRGVLTFVGGSLFMFIAGFWAMAYRAPGHEVVISPVYKIFVRILFFPAHFFPQERSFYGIFLGLMFWSMMAFWLSKRYFERKVRRQK